MIEGLTKMIAANPELWTTGGGIFTAFAISMWYSIRTADKERNSREKREALHSEQWGVLHKQTTDALNNHAKANSEIAESTQKQAASVVELSTLIKLVVLKDK